MFSTDRGDAAVFDGKTNLKSQMIRIVMTAALLTGIATLAQAQGGPPSSAPPFNAPPFNAPPSSAPPSSAPSSSAPLARPGTAPNGTAAVASEADTLVRITQMDRDGVAIGTAQEARCPANGCQMAAVLRIGPISTPYEAVVTFAGQGVYVVLESPTAGVQVHLYGDTRPTPLFLPRTAGNLNRLIHIAIDKPGDKLGGQPSQARLLASQDTWLRIEIDPHTAPAPGVGG